ncbi:penicillin-binding protein [Pedobacter sp. KLB.chiD]|uniref:penicillin-binding protein n=1 Tax=Pedobacter sp. KLB.chiD TaxID=3387402 RepID=UPI00399B2DDD
MTRSNLHITLSNGKKLICVADSSSTPEQGYIVEHLIRPLLELGDPAHEIELLEEHCTMHDRRCNACYRYYIDLQNKTVKLFEEIFSYKTERFKRGADLTKRYNEYVERLK